MPAPKAILRGIDDKSTRQIPTTPSVLSQHTPLLMLMTKRGRTEPTFTGVDMFDILYDDASLDVNSRWHSHQTELMRIAIETANSTVVIKRIVDEDTKVATVCVGKQPQGDRIVTCGVDELNDLQRAGKIDPILQFSCANPGAWGNRIGIQIFKASDNKQTTLGTRLDAIIYEAIVVEEDEMTGTFRTVNNVYGEPSTFFVTKPDAMANGVDYYFDTVMTESYIQDPNEVTRPEYFSEFKLHKDTLAALAVDAEQFWKEDLISNLKSDGLNAFREGLPIFAQGGDDGFHNYSVSVVENRIDRARKYEDAVRIWLASIDDTDSVIDMAQYPYSTLWDSGFVAETKKEFKNLLKYRKDIWIAPAVTSIYRYLEDTNGDLIFETQPALTTQESISLGAYYRSIFSGIPESEAYGTPTVRATLMGQDGVNRKSRYRKRQSLNVDLFEKVCKYCGSGDSKWKSQYAFDQGGLNTIKDWQDISMDYISPTATDNAWDAGLIYVQNLDERNKFYPSYQTIYPDDTSVLNNIFTMMACCWIEKNHFKAWTTVTGDSKSTNLEIAERLDQYLNSRLMNAFDGRFITVSKTYYTDSDEANGFSFTTDTTIYSNVTKRVANYKIIAYRMSDAVQKEMKYGYDL